MTSVARRLQAADLLLGRAEKRGEFFLGQAGLLAKGDDLQGDIPGFTGLLETGGKRWVLKLFFEITVEIGLVHRSARSCQSRIRSRAVLKSRTGMAWPLLRIPWTVMIRRCLAKNHSTRVFNLPT